MKRDMDLIRALLLSTEGENLPDLSKWTEAQQVEHMALLVEAKLVHGEIMFGGDGEIRSVIYTRLTWDGHEFLASARDDTVWKNTRDKLQAFGTNVAWPILTSVLTDMVKKKIGLP